MSSRIAVFSNNRDQTKGKIQAITSSQLVGDEWTIDNKYYSANVSFRWETKDLFEGFDEDDEVEGIPAAVIWIFENDKEAFLELSPFLNKDEVEVKLALTPLSLSADEDAEESLDEFFIEHGYELVFMNADGRCPRMIDALSTIMWPNMVQKPSTSSRNSKLPSDLLASANSILEDERDDATTQLDEEMIHTLGQSLLSMKANPGDGPEKYTRDFENWLEADNNGIGQKDRSPAEFPGLSDTPADRSSHTELKFDDDFGPFQSTATIPRGPSSSSTSKEAQMENTFSTKLPSETPSPQGAAEEDDEDVDLPTRAEILETSRRLFPALNQSRNTNKPASTGHRTSASKSGVDADYAEGSPDADDGFDFASILSSLQGVKEEIAGIEDMDERRKAAAKVALGLVWALEGDD